MMFGPSSNGQRASHKLIFAEVSTKRVASPSPKGGTFNGPLSGRGPASSLSCNYQRLFELSSSIITRPDFQSTNALNPKPVLRILM
jgi:hypothetical protein